MAVDDVSVRTLVRAHLGADLDALVMDYRGPKRFCVEDLRALREPPVRAAEKATRAWAVALADEALKHVRDCAVRNERGSSRMIDADRLHELLLCDGMDGGVFPRAVDLANERLRALLDGADASLRDVSERWGELDGVEVNVLLSDESDPHSDIWRSRD